MDAQRAARGSMGRMFGRGGPWLVLAVSPAIQPRLPTRCNRLGQRSHRSIKDLLGEISSVTKGETGHAGPALDHLRKVLSVQQEAQAKLMGLLN